MPVVSGDWLQPARWAPAQSTWALLRDGDQLLFARQSGRGRTEHVQLALAEAKSGQSLIDRIQKEQAKGARLILGLGPDKLLMRSLHSPLRARGKSDEIWPSLLDAAIPFPLERCQAAFLEPKASPEGGLDCLALWMRLEDLETELDFWQEHGLQPDALFPELLAVEREGGFCWKGDQRGWLLHVGGVQLRSATVLAKPQESEGVEQRFCLREDLQDLKPLSSRDLLDSLLERGWERGSVNLLGERYASASLQQRYRKQRLALMSLGVVALLLLLGYPLAISAMLSRMQEDRMDEIATLYQDFDGPRAARGQELLRAKRYVSSTWEPLEQALLASQSREVGPELRELMLALSSEGLLAKRMLLQATTLELELEGSEDAQLRVGERLKVRGWRILELKPGTLRAERGNP